MRADDIMSVDVVTVAPETDITDIARTLIEYRLLKGGLLPMARCKKRSTTLLGRAPERLIR